MKGSLSEQIRNITQRAQACCNNDIPFLSGVFDAYDNVRERIVEHPVIHKYQRKFKELGISSTLSSIDGLMSDIAYSYDTFANATGINPLSVIGIDPSKDDKTFQAFAEQYNFAALKQSITQSIKDFVFSPEHKQWVKTNVALPAVAGLLAPIGLSSMAPAVLSAAAVGYTVVKIARHMHVARRERQGSDNVDRSDKYASGKQRVLASGTAAAIGAAAASGVTASGAWSHRTGVPRSQVDKADATVQNLKLKMAVYIHDAERTRSELLKIDRDIEDIRGECITLDGTSTVEQEMLRLYDDALNSLEDAANALSRICEKLNTFKNTV
ncbi:hypothetical protein QUW48_07020 [Bifidobacterium pullorum]|uniref:hypothetical protein n=1 Tax=Bifidobacterium pullorum TaxID=78448 RepID=UPI0025A49D0A|nr:hypothetical protein [Bifidobacterium pullorum]MDM8323286.1 hypothetical protein [Bifidobacterium pullorum]